MNNQLKLLIGCLGKSFLVVGGVIWISAFITWTYYIMMVRVWIGFSVVLGLILWFAKEDDAKEVNDDEN